MSNGWDAVEQRKEQAKIDANKLFIRCAKKMAQIAYGKIDVKPDPSDPLKKTIGVYKTAWYDIHFSASIREVRKRIGYSEYYDRYQYEPYCKAYFTREVKGPSNELVNSIVCNMKWKLGRFSIRSPKKFLSVLKTIEEMIDKMIYEENIRVNERNARNKLVNDVRSKIKGLQAIGSSYYIGDQEVRSNNSWGSINVDDAGTITVRNLSMSVDQFNELTKLLGWRKDA